MGKRMMEVFSCDGFNCQYVICPAGLGDELKMCKIVFGVHPTVVEEIWKKEGRGVVIVQKGFYFCSQHSQECRKNLTDLMGGATGADIRIEVSADLVQGYGCWVTIHDRLLPTKPVNNFQLPYNVFEKVFRQFEAFLRGER